MTNNGKRIEKFITECEQHGIKFAPKDRGRIMSGFERRLVEEFGEGFAKATFEEIMSTLDGCGIRAIEEYIQQMDADMSLSFDADIEPEQTNTPTETMQINSDEIAGPIEHVEQIQAPDPVPEKNSTQKEKTSSNKSSSKTSKNFFRWS